MPYDAIADLPASIRRNLPGHAREIYMKAYNNAWEQYRDPEKRRGDASQEEVARRVAWAAVKHEYEKDSETGRWEQKPGFRHH